MVKTSPKHQDVGGPPPSKRSKTSNNNSTGNNHHEDKDEITAIHAQIRRAWEHYRNFIDGDGGEDDDAYGGDEEADVDVESRKVDEDEEDEEEETSNLCENSDADNDGDNGIIDDHQSGEEDEGGGDVDELFELIQILSSTKVTPRPFALSIDTSGKSSGGDNGNTNANSAITPFHKIESLVPILLSMSYLHLASHTISEAMFDPNSEPPKTNEEEMEDEENHNGSSSSSPDYYFQKSLQHWPTNPAAHSLLANYHRMNSLSSVEEICEHYVKAAEYARTWRERALEFLQSEEEEEVEVEDTNAKEWVELLVLNGALDVDYIGEDSEDEGEDEDKEGSTPGDGGNEKQEEGGEDYSSSQVEATASFMSAFLMSTMSRHEDALPHLRKFRLSHRIHPNVWKEAQQCQPRHSKGNVIEARRNGGKVGTDNGKACDDASSARERNDSTVFFPPRMYHGSAAGSSPHSNDGNSKANLRNQAGGNDKEGVLPLHPYQRLCALLAPNAPYWKESDYDHRGYYSYFIDLDDSTDSAPSVRERPTNVIEEVIVNHLLPMAERTLEESTETLQQQTPRIVGAEWWAHTRPLGANLGHQIHFDTDELLLGREKRVTHPIVSSVLYLTGGDGAVAGAADYEEDTADADAVAHSPGSTVVFDQTPNSKEVASRAWVSRPRNNSFMAFPGNLLHGVLPCAGTGKKGLRRDRIGCRGSEGGAASDSDEKTDESTHRLTFMVGFWTRNVTDGMGERKLYSPCGPLPPASAEHSWVVESQTGYNGDETTQSLKGKHDGNENTKRERRSDSTYDMLPSVSPAWEQFDGRNDEKQYQTGEVTAGEPPLTIPKGLDHRFFVWNAPCCFSESLFEKEDCF